MLKYVLAAATVLAFPLFSPTASATPFVDVRATIGVGPGSYGPLPDGLTLSCRGSATGGADGCLSSLSLRQTVTASGTYSVSSTGSLVITNTSDHTINDGAGLAAWFSAFNPGGPSVGISIDDAGSQSASFTSSVSVSGIGNLDRHGCAVGTGGQSGTVFTPTTCGVGAPDSSEVDFGVPLIDLLPGAEVLVTFAIDITAIFDLGEDEPTGVPEPASALIVVGLGALMVRRRGVRERAGRRPSGKV